MSYETLRFIWWLILGALLIGFTVTDGFDLGLGVLFRFIGRTDEERRALLESVEPVWEGNQVWLILGGGTAFAAWPLLYASSFSGLYPVMFLVLVALILRPVGFAFRNKVPDVRWRQLWDWALLVAGTVPAVLFGAAFGNLFIGLPFHFDTLMRPVYTGGLLNLLGPFALLAGLVSLSMLVAHGAVYAALKVGEPMATRAASAGRVAMLAFMLAFIAAGVWLSNDLDGHRIVSGADPLGPSNPLVKHVRVAPGAWLDNFRHHPVLWLVPAITLLAAGITWVLLRIGRPGVAFASSSVVQAGTLLTAGVALFPFLMPSSTHPDQGLTVWDASSSARTLSIMLVAVLALLPIVLAYTSWVFRVLRGRITLDHIREQGDLY